MEYVSGLSVEGFGELYSSLMRIKTRDEISLITATRQAYHADGKGITKYMKSISQWLPKVERNGPRGTAKDFDKALKRK